MNKRIKIDILCILMIGAIIFGAIILCVKNTGDASFEEPVIVKTEDNTVLYEYKENAVNPTLGSEALYSPYGYTIVMEDNGQSQRSSGNDKHTGEVF